MKKIVVLFIALVMMLSLWSVPVFAASPRGDSATGVGDRILSSGTWFMYNTHGGEYQVYDIQAGNPLDGTNIIGTYTITTYWDPEVGDFVHTATYDINDTIMIEGHTYDIVVKDEHLAVSDSDTPFTSANPGKLDNRDFGVPFTAPYTGGWFYVFAHFEVEYR